MIMQKNIFMLWRNCQFGDEQEEHQGVIVVITIIAITDGISVTPDCDKCDISCSSGKIGTKLSLERSQLGGREGQVEVR